jgi:hypothetical protein
MKLNIIKGHHLSRDLSIFGMLCYSPGEVTVYNNKYEPVSVSLDSPAVFIESEVYFRSDISCESITLAHEAYHWHKHRAYALTQSLHSGRKPRGSRDRDGRGRGREPIADSGRDGSGGGGEPIAGIGSDGWGGGGKSIVSRCAVEPSGSRISDIMQPNEDWMEWQANRVAPKILMPLNTVKRKAADLAGFFHYTNNSRNSRDSQKIMEYIIDEIAEVYKVTREAARIRMVEIGYEEAARVYRPQTVE